MITLFQLPLLSLFAFLKMAIWFHFSENGPQFNYCPLIWMFSSIRSSCLCHNDYTSSYDELISKQGLVKIYTRNIQQLMIEIFGCLKGISPPIMNDILSLINITHNIRNLRDPFIVDLKL